MQYFEKARFEYHAEHAGTRYEVQLGLLGDELTARTPDPLPARRADSLASPTTATSPRLGRRCNYAFLAYWESQGGLDRFGYPISDEMPENGRTVQYFPARPLRVVSGVRRGSAWDPSARSWLRQRGLLP